MLNMAEHLIDRQLREAEGDLFMGDVTIQLSDLTPEEATVVFANWKKRQYRPREVPGTRIAQWQARNVNGVPSVSYMIHTSRRVARKELINIFEFVRVSLIQKWIGREIEITPDDVLFRPAYGYQEG